MCSAKHKSPNLGSRGSNPSVTRLGTLGESVWSGPRHLRLKARVQAPPLPLPPLKKPVREWAGR